MAEAIARRIHRGQVQFVSAGLYAIAGSPATREAVDVAAEAGADLAEHAAMPLESLIELAPDLIYVMTRGHLSEVISRYPEWSVRVRLLDPAGGDVVDPYGRGHAFYRFTRERIHSLLEARAAEWT